MNNSPILPDDTADDAGDVFHAVIEDHAAGERLDKALAMLNPDLSRTRLKSLILSGDVLLNDAIPENVSFKVRAGDRVSVTLPPLEDDTPQPENIPLNIVYEDDDLIVINKAVGMVVHPAVGNRSGTLVNALLHHCGDTLSGIGGVRRPGIVHRLDKDTSGLMIVAKNDKAHQHLARQLASRELSRLYSAMVMGIPTPPAGTVNQPIGRHATQRLKMSVHRNQSREAITHYTVRERYKDCLALIDCKLETGRTHQIRVHMEFIKHPLVGDPLYGPQPTALRSTMKKAGYEEDAVAAILAFPRQALHAREIAFIHPATEEEMRFEADLPPDFYHLISVL